LGYNIGMKKWQRRLVVGSIVIIAGAGFILWRGEKCDAEANKCVSDSAVPSMANESVPPQKTIEACRESRSYLCRMFAPANFPNILLVLVGIAGIFAAIGTLGILERQTKATEDAAEASKASVKATIATQRGLLIANLMRQASKGPDGQWRKTEPYVVALSDEQLLDAFFYRYKLRVTNIGKTTAVITGYEFRISLLGKGETRLPPNSGHVIDSRGEMRTVPENEPVDLFQTQIDGFMSLHRGKINKSEVAAVFHGWVKYRPVIDPYEDYFADFCYVYNPEQEVLIRRDEYNTNRHDTQKDAKQASN